MSAAAVCGGSPAYMGERDALENLDWLTPGVGTALAACVVGFVGMVTAVVGSWRKAASPAELQKAISDAAHGIVTDLRVEVDRLQNRVAELEDRSLQCEGENRQLRQWADSLVAILRENGIPIPVRDLSGTWIVMEGDRRTVFKPTTKKPKE